MQNEQSKFNKNLKEINSKYSEYNLQSPLGRVKIKKFLNKVNQSADPKSKLDLKQNNLDQNKKYMIHYDSTIKSKHTYKDNYNSFLKYSNQNLLKNKSSMNNNNSSSRYVTLNINKSVNQSINNISTNSNLIHKSAKNFEDLVSININKIENYEQEHEQNFPLIKKQNHSPRRDMTLNKSTMNKYFSKIGDKIVEEKQKNVFKRCVLNRENESNLIKNMSQDISDVEKQTIKKEVQEDNKKDFELLQAKMKIGLDKKIDQMENEKVFKSNFSQINKYQKEIEDKDSDGFNATRYKQEDSQKYWL